MPQAVTSGGPTVLTIGRAPNCDYRLEDVLASRHHAQLAYLGNGQVELRDLNSLNGTLLDGQFVAVAELTEGQTVTIGNTDLVFTGRMLKPRPAQVARTESLIIRSVDFTVPSGARLLHGIDLTAPQGSLTAIIGPSGAGKSTLGRLVTGATQPSAGTVEFAGRDLHRDYAALRNRIGFVPQDDVIHGKLTVAGALSYAAALRLPPDTAKAERQVVCDRVLEELGLTERAKLRIDKLSGGQRKRASVAIELLTEPTLLVLDEPTSGLDPALDRQVMQMLRSLANAGRIVMVVTHSLTFLDMCDQVLLLAPGGLPAFCGPPKAVPGVFGTADWATVFERVADDPQGSWQRHVGRTGSRQVQPSSTPPPAPPAPPPKPTGRETRWQLATLVRRQARLMVSDVGYSAFLAALPIVLGLLALVVPGQAGFTTPPPPEPGAPPSSEANLLLVLVMLGACFMGASLSVRDLVGERPIMTRERAAGLIPEAYLGSKLIVFGLASAVQSVILVSIVLLGKPDPGHGAWLKSGTVELVIDVALMALCSAVLGLLISSLVRSNEQAMPLLVVVTMTQLVMCGGMIPVTGRAGLDWVSFVFPSRWGFAAAASTVDLRGLVASAQRDALWRHGAGQWFFAVGVLVGLTAALTVATRWRLARRTS